MATWAPSEVSDDLGDQCAIRVWIPDPLAFSAISQETQEGRLCRIHQLSSTSADDDSSSTPGPDSGPSGGFLLFSGPKSLYEKSSAKVPNCFVAGRLKKLNDLVFSSKFGQISRHHFAIGIYKSQWVVFNLSRNGTWVNDDYLLGERNMLALHPEEENEIRLGSPPVSLHVRCQYLSAVRLTELWPSHDTVFSEMDSASQLTSIAPTQYRPSLGPDVPRIYYLKNRKLPSRNDVPKLVALDARSCDLFVAKAYSAAEKDRLQKRMNLLRALPRTFHGPFLQDHLLIAAQDTMYSLVPYLGMVESLSDVSEFVMESTQSSRGSRERYRVARQLFRNLIGTVSLLHERYKISHGDLSLQNIFSDCLYDCEQIFVSGFSEAAPLTPIRAKSDCLAIFNIIRNFLHDDVYQGWFAKHPLDSIWNEFASLQEQKDWPYTVIQLRDMLSIRGDDDDALWRRLTISKDVAIRYKRNDSLLHYRIEDIRSFVTLAAIASFIAEPRVARENIKTAGSVLQRYIRERGKEDYISEESFDSFSLYMTKNHAINIPIGNLLSLGGLKRCQEEAASSFVVASVNFKIPYHTRHGWINLSSIQLLATSDFPPPLRSLINECYEVRGHCCGIYVPMDSHLETLAGHLGLRYSCDEIVNQGDKGLEQYTWANGWFILCPNESADLVPVGSAHELVWGRDSLGKFLSTHMPHNPLDAKTKQDPRALLMAHMEPGSTYDGTLESSSDPLAFSFGNEEKRDVKTSFEKASRWVETDASCTRQRRRQANMIRTDFHK